MKKAITSEFIHRQGLFALLIAPLTALSLHLLRFPFWMLLFALFVFCWRIQIYRGVWVFPSKLIRVALVFTALAAVILSYQQWYSLEPMVFLLIMAFLLKILEVREQRDALILVFVAYFVAASAFLFEQGIVITVLGVLVISLLTACLFILQASTTVFLSRRTLKQVSLFIVQAVPLMLLMFFLFPKIGALWSVPIQSEGAVTGVSDSMSPGDFSQLTQSREVAFRVSFENDEPPPAAQRYWRGLVLTQFDGRRWQRTNQQRFDLFDQHANTYQPSNNEPLRYEITMEPTSKRWLYGIALATVEETSLSNNPLVRNPYNELVLKNPIAQRLRYSVQSTLGYNVKESPEVLRESLLLPRDFNPKTIEQAQKWRQQSVSVEGYINRVLNFYTENFTYTLSPEVLGEHTADEFLFSTQGGFCEHFSSSFVILMRAVGIPARVVVGYQGGEWNTADNYLIVRQQEAHAWAEVWIEQKGWVRVDPTAAVAPNRIERNLAESLSPSDQLLVGRSVLPSLDWVRQLSLRWDSLNYSWQRWVLKYDDQQQYDLLKMLLGQVTALRMAMLLMIPAALCFCLFAFFLFRSSYKKTSQELKLYHALQKKLKAKGVVLVEGETVSQLCRRACGILPKASHTLQHIDHGFDELLYSNNNSTDKSKNLKAITALLRKL